MTRPILVAYATRRESSHEVAEAVAARLRELGHEADVRPAAEVGTLAPYGAVVIGGALLPSRPGPTTSPRPSRPSPPCRRGRSRDPGPRSISRRPSNPCFPPSIGGSVPMTPR
jgi:hypothetical protein